VSATLASALQISPGCRTTLATLVASPDAACLNPAALVPIVLAKDDASIIEPVNNWLNGLCSRDACTNANIAAIVANVTSGCSQELQTTPADTAEITVSVQTLYPTVRKVVCLKDNSKKQFCLTEELQAAQDVLGVINVVNLANVIRRITNFESGLKNVTCTNCFKQAFNIIKADFPNSEFVTDLQPKAQQLCGADFIDGKTPSDVVQTAGTSSGGSTSGSSSSSGSSSGSSGSGSTSSASSNSKADTKTGSGAATSWSLSIMNVGLSALAVVAAAQF
jgi:uncharacterized membrane protein YgcG